MHHHRKRFKLLLDEMLPRREKLPELNRSHDLKHIVHELRKAGLSDEKLVAIAKEQQRIIISKNIKHLQEICRRERVEMIGITETIPPEELDLSIMAYLRTRKHKRMSGAFKKIVRAPRRMR